ncbi:MAG: ribose-phosphate diphosphokinase [Bacteroidota bacterium]|nr:ribose-phosphate diphosphokinase [Bacteroidota bacterium]
MTTINLFESNERVELKKFAGGENHVRFLKTFSSEDKVRLNTRLNSADDIMTLSLAVDALRQMNVQYIEVFIPYIPYARQDRVMVPGEPLSIKIFTTLINNLELNKVIVFDAHSDVSVALLNKCQNIPNHEMVKHLLKEFGLTDFTLVSPDLGAYKKVDKLAQKLEYKKEIATGLKIRDLATGQIIKSDVNTEDLQGKSCVIVDDICDGGRTFTELAKALKLKNAGDLYLIVSHGIFVHDAINNLKAAGFKGVASSDSIMKRETNEFFKQYNLF